MRKVFTAANPEEATFVQQMLEGAGVRAVVQGSSLWGVVGELPPWNIGPTVWVGDDDDFERASALLSEHMDRPTPTHCENCGYDLTGLPEPRCPECGQAFHRPAPRPEPGPAWECPKCGEKIEGQFSACWKCGHEQVTSVADSA